MKSAQIISVVTAALLFSGCATHTRLATDSFLVRPSVVVRDRQGITTPMASTSELDLKDFLRREFDLELPQGSRARYQPGRSTLWVYSTQMDLDLFRQALTTFGPGHPQEIVFNIKAISIPPAALDDAPERQIRTIREQGRLVSVYTLKSISGFTTQFSDPDPKDRDRVQTFVVTPVLVYDNRTIHTSLCLGLEREGLIPAEEPEEAPERFPWMTLSLLMRDGEESVVGGLRTRTGDAMFWLITPTVFDHTGRPMKELLR